MKKPVLLRLDPELIDRIEAYRVRKGLKATAEATRRLIEAGLAENEAPPNMEPVVRAALKYRAERSRMEPAGPGLQLGPTRPSGAFQKAAQPKKGK